MSRFRTTVIATVVSLIVTVGAAIPASATDNRPGYKTLMAQILTSLNAKSAPDLVTTIPRLRLVGSSGEGRIPTVCFNADPSAGIPPNAATRCSFGWTKSAHTILLFGDDKALMWVPALSAAAYDLHWKLIFIGKQQCSAWAYRTYAGTAACRSFVRKEIAFANVLHARYVIPMGNKVLWRGSKNSSVLTLRGEINATLDALRPSRSRPMLFMPIPEFNAGYTAWSPSQCLIQYPTNLGPCETVIHNFAVTSTPSLALARVARDRHIPIVQSKQFFCADIRCALFVSGPTGNYLVYRDKGHMSRYYANYMSRAVAAVLWHMLS
jgi:hypothetical protein